MLVAALLGLLSSTTPLDDGWSWRKGDLPVADGLVIVPADGWEAVSGAGALRRSMKDDATMWLRHPLPAGLDRDAALALDVVIGHFEVFVGQRRVYAFPQGQGVEARGLHGLLWHVVPLAEDAGGKDLLIRVRSSYNLAGIQGVPALTTRAEYLEQLMRDDTPRFLIGCLLWLLAVLLVVALGRDERPLAIALGTWAATAGTYVLFYTRLKQLLLPVPPPLWTFLYVVTLSVLPPAWLFVVDRLFLSRHRWLDRLRRALVWTGAGTIGVSLGLWAVIELIDGPAAGSPVGTTFFVLLLAQRVALLVGSGWSTVIIAGWARGRGEVADVARARVLLAGIMALLVATTLNVLASAGLVAAPNLVPLGMLALAAAMVVLAQQAWRESRERALASERALTQRQREKEAMLRDLHDGIGSVTTNIRMLAELGRRDERRAAESLATIAELSSEGIAELRTFIQSLDETQVDWALLSAELRRFGGQLIESQGMQFQLDADLSDAAPLPTGAVTLALLRIFREALTNVVKHANAKEVRARLVVTARGLTLEVHDDGEGGAGGGGLDTGRGLRNMRTRAEELGGQFRFARAGGTRVSVELPLAVT